jgi:hypothetical protein
VTRPADRSLRPRARPSRATKRPPRGRIRQESIGGSLQSDGTFAGTFWVTTGPEPEGEGPPEWDSTPSAPTESQVAALRALVADLLARAP